MGMIGRYIDGLTDEPKDRVVRALYWARGGGRRNDGPMCLVQHAAGRWDWWYKTVKRGRWIFARTKTVVEDNEEDWRIAYRFDVLCIRFGLPRIVRAIKLRAGATLPAEIREHTPEHV